MNLKFNGKAKRVWNPRARFLIEMTFYMFTFRVTIV